jgi:hypothetical protein
MVMARPVFPDATAAVVIARSSTPVADAMAIEASCAQQFITQIS